MLLAGALSAAAVLALCSHVHTALNRAALGACDVLCRFPMPEPALPDPARSAAGTCPSSSALQLQAAVSRTLCCSTA